jgi:uncharacterized protein
VVDRRAAYGEERVSLTGQTTRMLLVVVDTARGTTIRSISARKASRHERNEYYRQKTS